MSLSWVSSETDPISRTEVQAVYLSGDLRAHWKEGVSEGDTSLVGSSSAHKDKGHVG